MLRYGDEVISRDRAYVIGHERNRASTRIVSPHAGSELDMPVSLMVCLQYPLCHCKGHDKVGTIGRTSEITNCHEIAFQRYPAFELIVNSLI